MPAIIFEATAIKLSIINNRLTIYSKLPPRSNTAIALAFLHSTAPTPDDSLVTECSEAIGKNTNFDCFIHHTDKDHDLYHQDNESNTTALHYHFKFYCDLNQKNLAAIIIILEEYKLLTKTESENLNIQIQNKKTKTNTTNSYAFFAPLNHTDPLQKTKTMNTTTQHITFTH